MDTVGNVFACFLFISTHILFCLIFLGGAEAEFDVRGGEKLNSCLTGSCVKNFHEKNN